MVVGQSRIRDIAERFVPITRDLGREPNLVVWEPDDLVRRLRGNDPFATEIVAGPKLWLVGDDAELAALAD